jgi:hypothetical protein
MYNYKFIKKEFLMKQLLSLLLLSIIGSTLRADLTEVNPTIVFKDVQVYQPGGNSVGFEFFNKENNPLWVGVVADGDFSGVKEVAARPEKPNLADLTKGKLKDIFKKGVSVVKSATAEKANKIGLQIKDLDKPIILAIWKKNPGQVTFDSSTGGAAGIRGTEPDALFGFKPGKTVFVSYQDGKLKPQTGFAFGIFGRTDSNLSLEKNLADRDITMLPKPSPTPQVAQKMAEAPIRRATVSETTAVKPPVPPAPPAPPATKKPVTAAVQPVETTLPTTTGERSKLLESIRGGTTLRPVAQRDVSTNPAPAKTAEESMRESLEKSILARRKAIEPQSTAA